MLESCAKAVYSPWTTDGKVASLSELRVQKVKAWVQVRGFYDLYTKFVRASVHSFFINFLSVSSRLIHITHKTNNKCNELCKGELL